VIKTVLLVCSFSALAYRAYRAGYNPLRALWSNALPITRRALDARCSHSSSLAAALQGCARTMAVERYCCALWLASDACIIIRCRWALVGRPASTAQLPQDAVNQEMPDRCLADLSLRKKSRHLRSAALRQCRLSFAGLGRATQVRPGSDCFSAHVHRKVKEHHFTAAFKDVQ